MLENAEILPELVGAKYAKAAKASGVKGVRSNSLGYWYRNPADGDQEQQ
jgi:hypothetical protein